MVAVVCRFDPCSGLRHSLSVRVGRMVACLVAFIVEKCLLCQRAIDWFIVSAESCVQRRIRMPCRVAVLQLAPRTCS